MKLKKLITLLGITLATITSGQAFSDTVNDSENTSESNEIGYRLGQGFYENSLKQTYSCFSVDEDGNEPDAIHSDSGSGFIYNQDSFSNSLNVNGGIDLSFAVVNTNFNLGYDSNNLNNSTNLTFWQYTEAYRTHEIINPSQDLVLTQVGQRAYNKIQDAFDKGDKSAQNDAIDDFIQTCGTSYIDSYNEGSRVSTEIDLQADSALSKEEISGKIGVGFSVVDLSAELKTAHQEEHSNFSAKAHDYQEGVKADLPEDYIVAENSCRINDTDGGLTQACKDLTGTSWAKVESIVKGQTDEGNQFGLPGYTSVSELFTGKVRRAVKDHIKVYQQNYDEIQKLWEINVQAKTALEPFLSVDNQMLGARIRKSYNNLNKNINLLADKLVDCEDGYCIPDDVREAKNGIQKIDPMIISLAMLSKVNGIVDTSTVTSNAQITELRVPFENFEKGGQIIKVYDQYLDNGYDIEQLHAYNRVNTTSLQPMNGKSTGRYIFLVEMDQLNNFANILQDDTIDSKHVYYPIILNAEKVEGESGKIRLSVSNILQPIFTDQKHNSTAKFITPKLNVSLEGTQTTGTTNHLDISANNPIKYFDGISLNSNHPSVSTPELTLKLENHNLILSDKNGNVIKQTNQVYLHPTNELIGTGCTVSLNYRPETPDSGKFTMHQSFSGPSSSSVHCKFKLGNGDFSLINSETGQELWKFTTSGWQ